MLAAARSRLASPTPAPAFAQFCRCVRVLRTDGLIAFIHIGFATDAAVLWDIVCAKGVNLLSFAD